MINGKDNFVDDISYNQMTIKDNRPIFRELQDLICCYIE